MLIDESAMKEGIELTISRLTIMIVVKTAFEVSKINNIK